jgi:hypothetical protein
MSFKEFLVEQNNNEEDEKVMGAIIDFFTKNENITDKEVHALAEELGVDKHKFEEKIYELLSSFLSKGLRNKVNKEDLEIEDKSILDKAIKVELEHTEDTPIGRSIARNIVMDHVAEYGWKYYDELEKMERKLKKNKKL